MRVDMEKVAAGFHLSFEEMTEVAKRLFDEQTATEEIQAFLIALSAKGETAQEIAALATVMKSFSIPMEIPHDAYMDNCGTGGDGTNTFNISTTASFVLAGAGVKLAKHGNRKISSAAGSSDVLEALGIRLDFTQEELSSLLDREGLAFIYAPHVHPKMKRIGAIRRNIGRPTIFNLVGPLTNPLQLASQFTGISRENFVMEYASVLAMLGRERAVVVAGAGGMDEASLAGKNRFVLVENGDLIPFTLTADDVGLKEAPISAIRGGDAVENAEIVRTVLSGERGPHFDTVVFNAGVALFANGRVGTIQEGVKKAVDSILSGRALQKLEAMIAFSQETAKERVSV